MRVVRGRAGTPVADSEATARLLDEVGETGEPAVRVWAPHRIVAFGRRDANEPGYEAAAAAARDAGFDPVQRSVGGRAVAYDGETTLAFARLVPVEDARTGLDDRYEALTVDVQRALRRLGVPAERGEPADAFCPGQHSLQRDGKLVGIAQRVRSDAAVTSGVCIVRNHAELAAVLDEVYAALDAPFDPDAVGSVERAAGTADPDVVRETLETELAGPDATVEPLRET
ncbi:lipoate--protein ligase family protein [Haloarchaeobius sp. HRN-SO-5]|uniref:lipoate--protein ligase family protein n=1 Tax=Haloarchaeobius sp. HRN-SO-5 TaxID=3446118 RepID=UPI003EBB784D